MGDTPHRSADAGTGGTRVTQSHERSAGASARVAEAPVSTRSPGGTGLGGGGALPRSRKFGAERAFRGLTLAAGTAVLVIIAAIAIFLVAKAVPALRANTENFWSYEGWSPNETQPKFGIGALAFGTVLSSALALLIAVPVALGIALYLSHYAPRRLGTALGFLVDLLAAVPSVVFGLWGRDFFSSPVRDLSVWLNKYFGWIPIFGGDGPFGTSILLGSAGARDHGAADHHLALPRGVPPDARPPTRRPPSPWAPPAGRCSAPRCSPYGRPGIIAAMMLGLGRALGETIALALTLGITFGISFNIIAERRQHHRRQHRQRVRRGQRDRPGRAHRLRPGAVHHHADRQHHRAGDHLPPPGVHGVGRMTTTATSHRTRPPAQPAAAGQAAAAGTPPRPSRCGPGALRRARLRHRHRRPGPRGRPRRDPLPGRALRRRQRGRGPPVGPQPHLERTDPLRLRAGACCRWSRWSGRWSARAPTGWTATSSRPR